MTNEPIRCPQCEQPPTQVGKHWVCPEHGQISPEKPFAPLRLFLSYGHDANEELVRRIKADLEKRGHDVWFDKSEINSCRFHDCSGSRVAHARQPARNVVAPRSQIAGMRLDTYAQSS